MKTDLERKIKEQEASGHRALETKYSAYSPINVGSHNPCRDSGA